MCFADIASFPVVSSKLFDEPHQVKCPRPGCTKYFRNSTLLDYHLKYYHVDDKTKAAVPTEKRSKTISICTQILTISKIFYNIKDILKYQKYFTISKICYNIKDILQYQRYFTISKIFYNIKDILQYQKYFTISKICYNIKDILQYQRYFTISKIFYNIKDIKSTACSYEAGHEKRYQVLEMDLSTQRYRRDINR